jgi:hypothetical protein
MTATHPGKQNQIVSKSSPFPQAVYEVRQWKLVSVTASGLNSVESIQSSDSLQ